jgi:cytochrome c oxidase assembly factor CtaG
MYAAHGHLLPWSLPRVATSVLVISAFFYMRGWLLLRSDFPDVIPIWRLASFMSGLVSVWTVVASPLAPLDHRSLTLHMVKHLLLMTVAAPLVLAGRPGLPLLRVLSKHLVRSDVRSRPTQWEILCRHSWVCWLAATAIVIGWHLPVAFQLAMRSRWVHNAEDVCFLLGGLLFWWPVVQPLPAATSSARWYVALYLFMATLPCDILSAFLVFCNRSAYPYYLQANELFSLSPLRDQQCAGALMWVWVTFGYLIPAVVITMQILSPKPAQPAWPAFAVRSLNT